MRPTHPSPTSEPAGLLTSVQSLLEQAVADGAAQGETYFDLASVTKLFTTVTALALVDAGVLELDAPIGTHVAAYRHGAKSAVTLRHLLTHTSGLPAQWLGWHSVLSRGHSFNRDALIQVLLATELETAPGTHFDYSCAGFNTIMALAEHVTASPWLDLVHKHLLDLLPTPGISPN